MQISSPTVKTYIDYFESSFLIKRLQPYYFNIKKRIVKSPKIYLSDTGILHRLLNISDFESLQAYPLIGNSWAINTLETDVNYIITPASEDYLMRENVRVCCLFDFLNRYLPAIK